MLSLLNNDILMSTSEVNSTVMLYFTPKMKNFSIIMQVIEIQCHDTFNRVEHQLVISYPVYELTVSDRILMISWGVSHQHIGFVPSVTPSNQSFNNINV